MDNVLKYTLINCSVTAPYGKTRDSVWLGVIKDKALSLDDQKNRCRALEQWFQSPQGIGVSHAFASCVRLSPDVSCGQLLLQLGHCGMSPWLHELSYRRKWLLSPCLGNPNTDIVTSLNALPLNRNSVDCIVAPFLLESFGMSRCPLDEIDRVLKPMGYLVFCGINPFSLWGLAGSLGLLSCFGHRTIRLYSSLWLKQALMTRGYQQCFWETFYYIPPVRSSKWISSLAFLNEMGKMISPTPAGFYCLVVQKYEKASPSLLLNGKRRHALALANDMGWLGT